MQAVDYLLKPISFARLLKAVNTYFEIYTKPETLVADENNSHDFMFVRSDRTMLKIDFNDIIFIESYSDYIKIYLPEKRLLPEKLLVLLKRNYQKKGLLEYIVRTLLHYRK